MTPALTMRRYFETWNARDFAAFEAQLDADITFAGPLGTARGPAECRRGVERLSNFMERIEIIRMLADGRDVITWFELHTSVAVIPVANWAQVEDGKVRCIRVTFDPRPLLG